MRTMGKKRPRKKNNGERSSSHLNRKVRIHYWGSMKNESEPHYEGGETSVFDVDIVENTFGVLDRLVESVGVYGVKKYLSLGEKIGFNVIQSEEDLKVVCEDGMDDDGIVDLFIDVQNLDDNLADDEDEEDESYVPATNSDEQWSGVESNYGSDSSLEDEIPENMSPGTSIEAVQVNAVIKDSCVLLKNKRGSFGGSESSGNGDSGSDWKEDGGVDTEEEFEEFVEDEETEYEVEGSGSGFKTVVFYAKIDGKDPPLCAGMIFTKKKELKAAIKQWSINRGRQHKYRKDTKVKVHAVCKHADRETMPCKWKVWAASRKGSEGSFEIRTFQPKHTCRFEYKNKLVSATWVGQKYAEEMKLNPSMSVTDFRNMVMKDNKFYISVAQARKARRKAIYISTGSEESQFAKLFDYAHELRRTNPGSTIEIQIVNELSEPRLEKKRFQRIYICFSGVKKGFLAACRPWFGVDGTFLKGPNKGILLTAVGPDPNNGIYLIAYAVVEVESTESWAWFFSLLRNDLGIVGDSKWTVMSDKQKGLIAACERVFPNADHRFCVKHLHGNMMTAGHRGVDLKRALWSAAKCTTSTRFDDCIKHLYSVNGEAGAWLAKKNPREWSRSQFPTISKCDLLLNNLCESFNSRILEARKQSILTMLESLRLLLMEKLVSNRDRAIKKWADSAICPRIFNRMEALSTAASKCIPRKSTDRMWEVLCSYEDMYFSVDIEERICGCRKWQLTGIPCIHAIAALWASEKNPLEYVDDCYSVETYIRCYENCIFPINGPHEWEKTRECVLLPPTFPKTKRGRPKTKRRLSRVEILEDKEKTQRVKRKGSVTTCGFCGELGHNRIGCKLRKAYEASLDHAKSQGFQPRPVHEPSPEIEEVAPDIPFVHQHLYEEESLVHVQGDDNFNSSLDGIDNNVEIGRSSSSFTELFRTHPPNFIVGEKRPLVNKKVGGDKSKVYVEGCDFVSSSIPEVAELVSGANSSYVIPLNHKHASQPVKKSKIYH